MTTHTYSLYGKLKPARCITPSLSFNVKVLTNVTKTCQYNNICWNVSLHDFQKADDKWWEKLELGTLLGGYYYLAYVGKHM